MKRLAYLLLFIFILGQAFPQAGSLDNTFNDDGIALYHMGNGRGLVSLTDKSMIIMGDTEVNGLAGCYLMKLNEDSSIDSTWGTNGMVEFQIGSNGTYPYNIEQFDGGKLLVSGLVYVTGIDGEFFVAKFNIVDGSLDTSFNGTGYTVSDYSDDEEVCDAMVVQPDGKIVLGGHTDNGLFTQLLFARFDSDGTLDTSFGINGYTEIDASSQDEGIFGVDLLSNGTIVAVGYGFLGNPYWSTRVCMAKLDSDGNPMTSFGGDGVIIPSLFNATSYAWDVHVINDSLLLTGYLFNGSDMEFYLAKLDTLGVADENFATDGIHTLNLNPANIGIKILTTSDQKIYVTGTTGQGGLGDSQFLLTRFLADGSLDTSFDNDGYTATDIRVDWDEALAIAMQDDGKILLTGMSGGLNSNGQNEVPVVRYLNDFVPFNVEFTSDKTTVCVGGSVNFVDESTDNVADWKWSFEGGTPATSTDQNPEITYNTLGIFDVQLIVEYVNATIDTITKEDYVQVVDLTVAPDEPVGETAPCNGSSYEYAAAPVPSATYYDWEITPAAAGTISSDSETATLIPTDGWTGDFTIRVRGGNICGYGDWSDELEGNMNETPDEYELEGGGSYCAGGDGVVITLNGSEIGVDYELYLDSETTGSIIAGTGSEISFGLQTNEGGYSAIGFNNNNCEEYMINQVIVEILFTPFEPATPTGPTTICNEETSAYSSEGSDGADSYTWSLTPEEAGTISSNGLEATVTWNAEFSGTAMISLAGFNDCGEGNPSAELEVVVGGANPIISGEEMVCDFSDEIYMVADNEGSTYLWTVTGGTITEGEGTYMVTIDWDGEGNGSILVDEETADGCSGTSEQFIVTIDDCTGIGENDNKNTLSIYPNPAKEVLNISFNSNSTSGVIAIYDITGKVAFEKEFQGNNGEQQINVSNLKNGVYLIKIQTGRKVLTSKMFMKN